jgi:hypothetical protein
MATDLECLLAEQPGSDILKMACVHRHLVIIDISEQLDLRITIF